MKPTASKCKSFLTNRFLLPRRAVGRLFYIDGIIFHGDGRPYFLDARTAARILREYTRDQPVLPSPPPPPSLMNPGYLPGKLMCAYHVFVRPLYQRNGVTFDKIGYYYPFLLSPQGVARPALARCFVSSSFNCSSRDRQVFVELGGGGKKGKKRTGGIPLDIRLLFFRLCIKYPRERELDTCLFSSTLK